MIVFINKKIDHDIIEVSSIIEYGLSIYDYTIDDNQVAKITKKYSIGPAPASAGHMYNNLPKDGIVVLPNIVLVATEEYREKLRYKSLGMNKITIY